MFKNRQKLIAWGALIAGLISDNCLADNKSISGQLQLNESELKYSITLEQQPFSMPALLKVFCSFSKLASPQTISFTMIGKPWMEKPVLCDQFLKQVVAKVKSSEVLLALPMYLEELSNQTDITAQKMEIAQLQASVDALKPTLAFISKPKILQGIEKLPEVNRVMLLDLATRLVKKGMQEFSDLRDTLKEQIQLTDILTFDTAANTINRGFQSGQDYKKYTQIDGTENLAHFIHCFVVSRGYEIQQIDPPISMENLQILIRMIVNNSESDSELSSLAVKLEEIVCE